MTVAVRPAKTQILAGALGPANTWMLAAIVLILLVLVFLAVAETSLNRISKPKAQALVEMGHRSAPALLRIVSEPERFINPLLVTASVLQTAQAFLSAVLAYSAFKVRGVIVAFVVDAVLFFVLSEALPKTWAVLSAERAALLTARPTAALVRFGPLQWISRGLIGMANVLVPGRGLVKGPFVSETELLGIVGAAVDDEVIEAEERELIESIITFGDTVAREVMVPRPSMVTVPSTASVSAALDTAIEHGYSRLPVLGASVDDIVAIAYTKDLVRSERNGGGMQSVSEASRPAKFVPETKPLARLMREMQAEKFHMAILVDEYGGIAGLVTLEDCLEELVGDIVDEYDTEDADVVALPDGALRLDGGLAIDELNDLLGLDVPDEDWDTVGGFVFGTLGHVPEPGEHFEHGGYQFVAERVDGRRIADVRVSPIPSDADHREQAKL